MKIAITGGKGGTGKSTISTAFAVELAKKYKVMLVDADVECPDDHILLSIKREKVRDVEAYLPSFNEEKCIKCGSCAEVCKENAIVIIKDNFPFIIEKQCNGCGACLFTCKNKAIDENKQIIGSIYQGKFENDSKIADNFMLISGEIEVGCESSSPVVNETREFASKFEDEYDFSLIDTAAGTHCNVISALIGVDLALTVAEPTPLGKHDLDIILKLLKILQIKSEIIVNKSDIGDLSLIHELENNYGINVLSEIPYTKRIIENYSEGIPIEHDKIAEITKSLEQLL
ncbi:MAG: ATP-binding protein [Methanobacterium sp.]|nr:ATP-binding protein [Methanobacterium sp.]